MRFRLLSFSSVSFDKSRYFECYRRGKMKLTVGIGRARAVVRRVRRIGSVSCILKYGFCEARLSRPSNQKAEVLSAE